MMRFMLRRSAFAILSLAFLVTDDARGIAGSAIENSGGGAGSPFGYEIVTTDTTLTTASKRNQSCQHADSASIAITMPDCAAGTDGWEYVISQPVFVSRGSCVVLPGSGDSIGTHAAWVLGTAGEQVTVTCNSANNRWDITTTSELSEMANSWSWRVPNKSASTVVTAGQIAATITAPGGTSTSLAAGIGPLIQYCTTASTSNVASLIGSTADILNLSMSPRIIAVQQFAYADSPAADFRWFPLAILAASPSGADALAGTGAAIRWATGASDTTFQCCTHDGSATSCSSVPTVAIGVNGTLYRFTLQTAWKLGTACTVQVLTGATLGTAGSVWKTSNISSAGTTDSGVFTTVTTTANKAKCLGILSQQHRTGY